MAKPIRRPSVWPLAAGVAAPLVYVATVIVGGALTPGYSHLHDPISALIEAGAPAKGLVDPLFAIYDLLLIAFAVGARRRGGGAGLPGVTSGALAAVGLAGLLMWPLPMDRVGSEVTLAGIAHVALAAAESLGSLVAMVSLGLTLRGTRTASQFSTYCFASAGLLLATGAIAATAAANHGPLMGLSERLTIGCFQQWLLVVAVAFLTAGHGHDEDALRGL